MRSDLRPIGGTRLIQAICCHRVSSQAASVPVALATIKPPSLTDGWLHGAKKAHHQQNHRAQQLLAKHMVAQPAQPYGRHIIRGASALIADGWNEPKPVSNSKRE